jgi:histidinol phosphatase-like PHP family hydrolase
MEASDTMNGAEQGAMGVGGGARWQAYLGGVAHVHTRLSNYPGHFESNQTVASTVRALVQAGLAGGEQAPVQFMVVTEHASNPVAPAALRPRGLRARRLRRARWRRVVQDVTVVYGLEASLLPSGVTDLTPELAEDCAVVIGSRHYLPPELERDATAVMRLLEHACMDPAVDVLGHSARGIEGLRGVDWARVMATAAASGTAVEVNANTFPDPRREPARIGFWREWLRLLAASGAGVFLGTDLHNDLQMRRFVRDWRHLGRPGVPNGLGACLEAMAVAGIGPERVVTAEFERFRAWLAAPKAARRALGAGAVSGHVAENGDMTANGAGQP